MKVTAAEVANEKGFKPLKFEGTGEWRVVYFRPPGRKTSWDDYYLVVSPEGYPESTQYLRREDAEERAEKLNRWMKEGMKVTGVEVLQKMAAPLPGAKAFPSRTPSPVSSERPERPSSELQPPPTEDAPKKPTQEKPESEPTDLKSIIQTLDQHFTDEAIQDISNSMLALMKVIPPESSEKLSKVFTKFMEAAMSLKANIAALQVMTMPAQQQAELFQKNLQQLTQTPDLSQALKSGPIT
jgi:hypothetical protein